MMRVKAQHIVDCLNAKYPEENWICTSMKEWFSNGFYGLQLTCVGDIYVHEAIDPYAREIEWSEYDWDLANSFVDSVMVSESDEDGSRKLIADMLILTD